MTDVKRVSAAEAQELLDQGYEYVDVRSEGEYAAGHPTGAYNVPFMHAGPNGMTPNPDFAAVFAQVFPAKDAKLVVGCAGGNRSLRAVTALQEAGYTGLVDLRPGFGGAKNSFGQVTEEGWKAAGLPVENSTAGRSYADLKG